MSTKGGSSSGPSRRSSKLLSSRAAGKLLQVQQRRFSSAAPTANLAPGGFTAQHAGSMIFGNGSQSLASQGSAKVHSGEYTSMRSSRRKEVQFTSMRHGRHEHHIEAIEEIEIEIAESSEIWGWYWYDWANGPFFYTVMNFLPLLMLGQCKWYCATANPEWIEFREVIKTGALCDDVPVLPQVEPDWW